MGKKVNPTIFRTGYIFPTKSVWYSNFRNYAKFVLEDNSIRRYLEDKLKLAGITNIVSKLMGSKNVVNNVKATFNGLASLRPAPEKAARRQQAKPETVKEAA